MLGDILGILSSFGCVEKRRIKITSAYIFFLTLVMKRHSYKAAGKNTGVHEARFSTLLSDPERESVLREIKELRSRQCQVILLSTGSLVGEGFDLPELDTLILATPLSFEGRMIQYAGRLHRLSGTKSEVQIIDFVDSSVAMCLKMYRNRVKAYRKMGYQVTEHGNLFAAKQVNLPIAGPLR